jgi:hypothetical protein
MMRRTIGSRRFENWFLRPSCVPRFVAGGSFCADEAADLADLGLDFQNLPPGIFFYAIRLSRNDASF